MVGQMLAIFGKIKFDDFLLSGISLVLITSIIELLTKRIEHIPFDDWYARARHSHELDDTYSSLITGERKYTPNPRYSASSSRCLTNAGEGRTRGTSIIVHKDTRCRSSKAQHFL